MYTLEVRRFIWRLGLVVGFVAFGASGFGVALAQGSTAKVSIDAPAQGSVLGAGLPVFIGGWAADPSGLGTGVNGVDVYLDGPPGTGRLLGSAEYGFRRPDVANVFGKQALTNSGFHYVWVPRGVPAGEHTVYVAARTQAGTVVVESIGVTVLSTSERGCSFIFPCYIQRSSIAWEIDTGGPGTRFDYFPETFIP